MAVRYAVETDGTFVIEDYNQARQFSGFFPGIAGNQGIPCWGFYQNRGQALAGFGFGNKDGALQEFVPADKAAWYAAWRGFRTLIKVRRDRETLFYEPFRCGNALEWPVRTKMTVGPAEVELEEVNPQLGLKVKVSYFTLAQEKVGGVYRKTELTNLGETELALEMVDGLAVMLPAGFSNFHAKNMGATIRAWMKTLLVEGVPYYKLNYLPDDVTELLPVHSGHFSYGYRVEEGRVRQLSPIYDPVLVFGSGSDYQPVAFRADNFSCSGEQIQENQLPAALHYFQGTLASGERTELFELYGAVPGGTSQLTAFIAKITPDYYEERREINRELMGALGDFALTYSGASRFDRYVRQCFLDNAIRGGIPVTLAGSNSETARVSWLYSRKHGDLERDYNDFYLSPSYYSQGNGNFRDICQNRRSDLWFNPDLRDSALRYFWNLIQLDGYNPLVVQGITYRWENPGEPGALLAKDLPVAARQRLKELTATAFDPGELWGMLVDQLGLSSDCAQALFRAIIQGSAPLENAAPGEGYWIDHWIYTLDLMEAFLKVYPDEAAQACLQRNDYTFYDNWNVLNPFQERFALRDGQVRRRDGVRIDPEKRRLIRARTHQPHVVRVNQGTGAIYRTHLLVKMLTLALNKLSSFDPFVTGLEMDADRPGWCDAINGLPGILGASLVEVFALKRLLGQIGLIAGWLAPAAAVRVPVEVNDFFAALDSCWELLPGFPETCLAFWERTHQIRERFLEEIRQGLDGREQEISRAQLQTFLEKAGRLVDQALAKAEQSATGLYHTYFYYQVRRWQPCAVCDTVSGNQTTEVLVRPLQFEQFSLPLFLEGQVYALRGITQTLPQAASFYRAVRASQLFDSKLEMYKVCADLSGAPEQLGRIRVFPRGWLENESIFLHMEYKYLLEMLRSGLVREFFAELPKTAVCYLKPEIYGRNPLENVSFIVSSAYPREEMHGSGQVARLSGSTAEMLQIWLAMSFGFQPFRLQGQEQLELVFEPLLTADFFSRKAREVEVNWPDRGPRRYQLPDASYCAKFLNRTLVIYHNPARKDTFGENAAQIRKIALTFWNGRCLNFSEPVIGGAAAADVRQGAVERIDVLLE